MLWGYVYLKIHLKVEGFLDKKMILKTHTPYNNTYN